MTYPDYVRMLASLYNMSDRHIGILANMAENAERYLIEQTKKEAQENKS